MSEPFRAHVFDDLNGWQRNTVRLLVVRLRGDQRQDLLMSDGTWQTVEEGTATIDPLGVELPRGAVEAVHLAVEEWRGKASHGATEARVLREWLAVEQARVDRLLNGGR